MGRPKTGPNRVVIDGGEYAWELRHGWMFDWDDSTQGISVSVSRNPGRTRELILDLRFQVPGAEHRPPPARVERAVVGAIRDAIEAGWDPESRGKAFRHGGPVSK